MRVQVVFQKVVLLIPFSFNCLMACQVSQDTAMHLVDKLAPVCQEFSVLDMRMSTLEEFGKELPSTPLERLWAAQRLQRIIKYWLVREWSWAIGFS